MQVTRIKFLNIMGLERFILKPGKFTRIKAPNAAGKSSMASGIVSIAKGGAHEAKLLRNGAKEGETVVEFDTGMSIVKRITEDGSDVSVRDEKGKKATSKPVALINDLLNLSSVNPISFFTAEKDDRKKILLKAIPVSADPARLEQITGQKVTTTGNAWDVIATLYKQIFQERTLTNRAATEKRNTINQLELALPKKADAAVVDMDSITAEIAKVDAVKDQKLQAIEKKITLCRNEHQVKVKDLRAKHDAETQGIRDQIRTLEAQLREKEQSLDQEIKKVDAELTDNENKASTARTDRTNEWKQARGALDLQMKEAKSVIEAEGRIKQSRETIAKMDLEAVELEETAAAQTKSLQDLDAYRLELMASLPIPGLELRGEDIYFNGVVWDGLNEATRMRLAFDIAKLQVGKSPFMFVDGAERLDHKNFALLQENALKSGVQCVTFEVDHDPDADGFKVEVVE